MQGPAAEGCHRRIKGCSTHTSVLWKGHCSCLEELRRLIRYLCGCAMLQTHDAKIVDVSEWDVLASCVGSPRCRTLRDGAEQC